MILNDYRSQFIELLYNACVADLERLKKCLVNESIFAYAIFSTSGFTGFGTSACTEHWLDKRVKTLLVDTHPDNLDKEQMQLYVECNAIEWGYYNNPEFNDFEAINDLALKITDAECDGELNGILENGDFDYENYDSYNDFFIKSTTEVLLKLKDSNYFASKPFVNNMMLSLQFANPSIIQKEFTTNISQQVNSFVWHKKLCEAIKLF